MRVKLWVKAFYGAKDGRISDKGMETCEYSACVKNAIRLETNEFGRERSM